MSRKQQNESSNDNNVVNINQRTAAVGDGLDTIKDILFGEQVKASNEQLTEFKHESEAALQSLSERMDERLAQLDAAMTKNFETLNQQLIAQHTAQAAAQMAGEKRLDVELKACRSALESNLASTRDEFTHELNQLAEELRDQKLDRHKLADIFSQAATELAGQPQPLKKVG
jgi:hypothetical protein